MEDIEFEQEISFNQVRDFLLFKLRRNSMWRSCVRSGQALSTLALD